MSILQELCLPDPYLLFRTEYSLAFIRDSNKLFHISSEQKLLTFKVIPIQYPLANKSLHQCLIIIIDEFFNWSIYSIKKGKQLNIKSLVEVANSKNIQLFEQFKNLTNKERRGLKCFVNDYSRKEILAIEIEITLSKTLYILECNLNYPELSFTLKIPQSKSSMIEFTREGKRVVHSVTFELNKLINQREKILGDVDLFDKIVCLQDESGIYEVLSILVTRNYQYRSGTIKITGIQSKPTGIHLTDSKLLVIFPKKLLALDLNTHEIKEYEQGGNLTVSNNRLLCKSQSQLFQLSFANNQIHFNKLLSNIQEYQYLILESQCYYGVKKNNSLDHLKSGGTKLEVSNVISSNSDKIDKVIHSKDQFSSILQLRKVNRITNEVVETEYYSNQPHLKQSSTHIHNINLKGARVLHFLQKSSILLTSQAIGSVLIEIQGNGSNYSLSNNPLFKPFQSSEVTLHMSVFQNVIIQVTPSKVICSESNVCTRREISQLLEIDVEIDHSIRLGNILVLAVHNQVHVCDFRNPSNPSRKFIYCFDNEIEYLSTGNNTNVILVKFLSSNTIDIYYVDYHKQLITLIQQITPEREISIKDTFTFSVKINSLDHCITLIRSNRCPLCLVIPNDQLSKGEKSIEIKSYQLKHLSDHLIPVGYNYEKYTFLSKDTYVEFPRSVVIKEAETIPITYTRILNTKSEEVYYMSNNLKNISLRLYKNEIVIDQERTGKFSLNTNTRYIIEGYKCDVQFSTSENKGTLKVVGYQKGLIEESEFKGREIIKIKSLIPIPQHLPSPISLFQLQFQPTNLKLITKGVYIIYNNSEIWLVRFLEKEKYLYLSIFSKFHYDNEEYIMMKNRLQPEDYENEEFLKEFNKVHKFKDIQTLMVEEGYCELLILYQKFLLVLEIHNMVFKIQQVIKPEYQIQTILDNFQPSKAYLRTKNTLYLLSKQSGAYQLAIVEELNDDIVLATQTTNWEYPSRTIALGKSTPETQTLSRLLIKSFGEISISKRDSKGGELSTREMYL